MGSMDRVKLPIVVRKATAGDVASMQAVDVEARQRFREIDDYWGVITEISPSLGGVIGTLDDPQIGEIKRDFAERCEPYREGDGYDLPGLSIGLLAR